MGTDDLLSQAIEVIRKNNEASISLLQRKLGISYPRAARLMDQLEEMGIVRPDEGNGKPRSVLSNWQSSSRSPNSPNITSLLDELKSDNNDFQVWGKATSKLIAEREKALKQSAARVSNLDELEALKKDTQLYIVELQQKQVEFSVFRSRISNAYAKIAVAIVRSPEPVRKAYEHAIPNQTSSLAAYDSASAFLEKEIAAMQQNIVNFDREAVENFGKTPTTEIYSTPKPTRTETQHEFVPQIDSRRQIENAKSLEELTAELNALIGLDNIKNDVIELVNFLKIQQLRKSKGMTTTDISLHSVFYGNPGTGKTTVARLLSEIYRSMQILSQGHLVETDRAGLVAGYVGQTALKVTDVVKRAIGGVLFIDEAYSLNSGDSQDFGQEAIETLLKQLEDHRDDLIVIVAGYTDKMDAFLVSNPGLRSRFTRFFRFRDYEPDELIEIFELFCRRDGYHVSPMAKEKLNMLFTAAYAAKDKTFGNARLARNIFERALSNQANRVVKLNTIDAQMLSVIEADDIPAWINDTRLN